MPTVLQSALPMLLLAAAGMVVLPTASGRAQEQPAAPAPEAPAAPAPAMEHDHGAPAAAAAVATPKKRMTAPADAYVYIGWPNDGEVVHSTHVRVWFGTRNFGIAPASVVYPNTGHHHLLIDAPLPPMDDPIPNDRTHLHFGRGQTEAVVELTPGKHTLQLLMGDADHIPHDPPLMSKKITVIVQP
jgi:Domain of unknown function (DUF4399)